MASHSSTIISSKFTEKDWIVHIERAVDNLDIDTFAQSPPSIFHVPESVRIRDRQSFSPRILALGPYHHWSPDLYQLENFKLAAAKRAHAKLRVSPDFKDFVRRLATQLSHALRASYDRHLSMSDAALSWIMAVDALFLLDFLYFEDSTPHMPSISRSAILRDVILLENQIPMLLLTEILDKFSGECSITAATGQSLISVSVHLCRRVSPLELPDPDFESLPENLPRHLLDLFYRLILSTKEKPKITKSVDFPDEIPAKKTVNFFHRASERILAWLRKVSQDDVGSLVPTATQLRDAGVRFRVLEYGGVLGIEFEPQTKTLSLPSFSWKPNCDVAVRNLVAYEAAAEPERPVLARYVDLMSGMLQSADDARVLEEEGIIIAGGEGACEVFGRGMGFPNGKCSTMLEGTIESINEFYKGNRKIEVGKTVKRYMRRLMEVGTFVAALCLLIFFCSQVVSGIFQGGSSGVKVTVMSSPATKIAAKMLPSYSGGSFLAE